LASRTMPEWRTQVLRRLDVVLIIFQLVLSAIFISVGYLTGNIYFRGVGVGLVIAWVTSGIALLYRTRMGPSSEKG
jgi:hypothetical protein